jgi:kynurenine formamidase
LIEPIDLESALFTTGLEIKPGDTVLLYFVGLPLKIRGGTGSPVRAIAVFEN